VKVYIAGPMTGLPQFNVPAFDAMAEELRDLDIDIPGQALKLEVISPAEMDGEEVRAISLASVDGSPDTLRSHGLTHGQFLARDIEYIADGGVQAVVVLPGWEESPGARHETFVAHLEGIPVTSFVNGSFVTIGLDVLLNAWAGQAVIMRVP